MVDVPVMAAAAPVMTDTRPVTVPAGDGLDVLGASRSGRRPGQNGAGDAENARKDETY